MTALSQPPPVHRHPLHDHSPPPPAHADILPLLFDAIDPDRDDRTDPPPGSPVLRRSRSNPTLPCVLPPDPNALSPRTTSSHTLPAMNRTARGPPARHLRPDFAHSKSASNVARLSSTDTASAPTSPAKSKPFSKRPALSMTGSLAHSASTTPASGHSANGSPTSSGTPAVAHHAVKTALWVSLAVAVALIVTLVRGNKTGLEFTTAYIVEYSLSVDNLFVFLIIFRYFKVPRESQESVLTYGIIGAMILRGLMIVCGKALIDKFEWVTIIFAVFLIYSAIKLFLESDDDDDDDAALDNNRIVRLARTLLPVSERYTGDRFFIYENSKFLATPLMVVLITIELSDVVFALDSVPAVLGLSSDTFVIYTSNILAIMGLRSLFFILSSSIGNFRFLRHALATVLGFIGIKMVASWLGHDVGTTFSLTFVACCLILGVACSVIFPAPETPGNSANGNGRADDSVHSNQSNLNNV